MTQTHMKKEVIDSIKNVFLKIGVDNLSATIISTIWTEPDEIGMEELAHETGYSLPSVCMKLKHFGEAQGIQKIHKPGSRKTYLYMDKDPVGLWMTKMRGGFKLISDTVKKNIPDIIKKYKNTAKTDSDRQILKNLESYLSQFEKLEKVMEATNKELAKIKIKKEA